MSHDATDLQSGPGGGYVSLVAHIWVDDGGKLIRGTIEDAHTGERLAIDISALAALLRTSLAHGQGWTAPEAKQEPPG